MVRYCRNSVQNRFSHLKCISGNVLHAKYKLKKYFGTVIPKREQRWSIINVLIEKSDRFEISFRALYVRIPSRCCRFYIWHYNRLYAYLDFSFYDSRLLAQNADLQRLHIYLKLLNNYLCAENKNTCIQNCKLRIRDERPYLDNKVGFSQTIDGLCLSENRILRKDSFLNIVHHLIRESFRSYVS